MDIYKRTGELIFHKEEDQLCVSDLDDVDLEGADLPNFDFQGIMLTGNNMREANLAGADFYWCVLLDVDLEQANLERANMQGVTLLRSNLRRANMRGLTWGQTTWVARVPWTGPISERQI